MKHVKLNWNNAGTLRGTFLVFFGVIIPAFVNEVGFGIYKTLALALDSNRAEVVLFAATKLVLMNCVRALPHYLGAFIISESLTLYYKGKRIFFFNCVVTFGVITLVYRLIGMLYPFEYDFGIPAILIVSFVLLLSYMDLFSVSWLNKSIILMTLLLSFQQLDVIPQLNPLNFGLGELSWDTKMVAIFLGYDRALGLYCGAMLLAFLLCSAIQVQLLYKEHRLQVTTQKNQKVEKELVDAQINALRMRSFGEVQSLVHDLKTPLTTIQGLVTLSAMLEEDEKLQEYLEKISNCVENMNVLITEILHKDSHGMFTTRELMKSVFSQISVHIPSEILQFENTCQQVQLQGNRIHLSRAIINLVNNSYQAISQQEGKISIRVYCQQGLVFISVWDNGCGIEKENLSQIWEPGFSRNQSTGLGLNYTRQVIEEHGGTIHVDTVSAQYTCITIQLKEAQSDDS